MPRFPLHGRLLALIALALPVAADPASDARELRTWLAAEHIKLAERCLNGDLTEEARVEFEAALAADPSNGTARDMLSRGGRRWILSWDDKRRDARHDYLELRRMLDYDASDKLAALGKAFAARGEKKQAEDAFRRAVVYDPESSPARAGIGEEFVEGQGWFKKEEALQRKKGNLPWKSGWLPADDVNKRHTVWADAWVVTGKHFMVRCNVSEDAARETLGWAEQLHTVLARETAGILTLPPNAKPLPIFIFATKEEYDEHVTREHPERIAGQAVGFFSTRDGAVHTWWRGDDGFTGTEQVIRHECTHQLMESMIVWKDDPTLNPGFWVFEGFARYFENIEEIDGKLVTFGTRHGMFPLIRSRLKADTAMPLDRMVELTQDQIMGVYEQAGVVTHFFMHARDGELREAFLKYVRDVHAGEANKETFKKRFGADPADFEDAWRDWALKSAKGPK